MQPGEWRRTSLAASAAVLIPPIPPLPLPALLSAGLAPAPPRLVCLDIEVELDGVAVFFVAAALALGLALDFGGGVEAEDAAEWEDESERLASASSRPSSK